MEENLLQINSILNKTYLPDGKISRPVKLGATFFISGLLNKADAQRCSNVKRMSHHDHLFGNLPQRRSCLIFILKLYRPKIIFCHSKYA